MTIEEMKERKREYGYTCETIAKLSGVPLGTVQKIFSGETVNPRQITIEKLTKILAPKISRSTYSSSAGTDCFMEESFVYSCKQTDENCKKKSYSETGNPIADYKEKMSANCKPEDCFREAVPAYKLKQQGEYTLDDYYAWPDDQRVELIDGFIYDMGAPYNFHQLIVGEIYYQIRSYIKSKNGSCIALLSPVDVQLDQDDKTMVQPDVGILCDRSKFIKRCVFGAPDFLVEIISPSSSKRDQITKLNKYMEAGVREYWVVDYKSRQVFVYFFESEELVKMYPLGMPVPVNIYDGDLVIDFEEIKAYIDEYAPD